MKIVKILLLILLLVLIGCEKDNPVDSATYSLSGVVLSAEDDSPIDGAVVLINSGAEAATNSDGSFAITDVKAGSYEISVEHAGYISMSISDIAITDDEELTIRMPKAE